jgi:perosamine synthetase
MRRFRNHGIDADLHQRSNAGTWFYEVVDMGFNYRLTDFQCALGLSQLEKIEPWINRRQEIARRYDCAFGAIDAIQPLAVKKDVRHVYHLYVVQLNRSGSLKSRAELFSALRDKGIGVNVHYIPLNLHPYYQNLLGVRNGQCPVAEAAYENILSLPIFPAMRDADVDYIVETIAQLTNR